MSHPAKRPRTTAYIDQVDLGIEDIDYSAVHVREGKLNKSGINNVIEPLPVREPLQGVSDAWRRLTAWSVEDSTTLALDPADGRLYNEALERHVMDDSRGIEATAPVARKRYPRSKVSVSLLLQYL